MSLGQIFKNRSGWELFNVFSLFLYFIFLTKDWIHSWKPILYSFILCWVGEKIEEDKKHVTLYIFKLGKMTAELKMVNEVYGVGLVGNSMYYEWFVKFKINLTLRTNLWIMTCKPHSMKKLITPQFEDICNSWASRIIGKWIWHQLSDQNIGQMHFISWLIKISLCGNLSLAMKSGLWSSENHW